MNRNSNVFSYSNTNHLKAVEIFSLRSIFININGRIQITLLVIEAKRNISICLINYTTHVCTTFAQFFCIFF